MTNSSLLRDALFTAAMNLYARSLPFLRVAFGAFLIGAMIFYAGFLHVMISGGPERSVIDSFTPAGYHPLFGLFAFAFCLGLAPITVAAAVNHRVRSFLGWIAWF